MTARQTVRNARINMEILEARIVPAWFLKMDSIPGESMIPGHAGEMEILSYSWGATNAGGGGGGGGAGKVSVHDLRVVKKTDSASPMLFQKCASGEHIKNAVLKLEGTSPAGKEFYFEYKFSDVLISSFQAHQNGGDSFPMDQVSFNFDKIKIRYEYDGRDRKVKKPWADALGPDLNGDGTKDPVYFDAGTIRDLDKDGMADMVEPPAYPQDGQPHAITHDLNGDGRPDPMPTCNPHNAFFDVFSDINFDGQADGQVSVDQNCDGQQDHIVAGDVNGDNFIDSFFDIFTELS